MGNSWSSDDMSKKELCLGRSQHKSTHQAVQQRPHVNSSEAKGNVTKSEPSAEATTVGDLAQNSGENQRSKLSDKEISNGDRKDVDANDGKFESIPDAAEENCSSESVIDGSIKSDGDESSETTTSCDASQDSTSESAVENVEDETENLQRQEHCVHCALNNTWRDEGNEAPKECEAAEKVGDSECEVALETGLEGKKEWRSTRNRILCRFMTVGKNTKRRKRENKVTEEMGTEMPKVDCALMLNNTSDLHEQEKTEVVTNATKGYENNDIQTKKRGILKKFFSRFKKRQVFAITQESEVKQNVKGKKRKLKFSTFIKRIKELERSKRNKDDCISSNGSSDSEIYTDIRIERGDERKDESEPINVEDESNVKKEDIKDETKQEQMAEKEQWRWEAEEYVGSVVLKESSLQRPNS